MTKDWVIINKYNPSASRHKYGANMTEKTVECPKCKNEFSVTEALSAEIEERYHKKFEKAAQKKEAEFEKRQEEIEKEKKMLSKKQLDLEQIIQAKVTAEKIELEKKIKITLADQSRLELEDLKNQINEKSQQVLAAQKLELEFRKKTRELEDKEKSVELELHRKFDEEKVKIEEAVALKIMEEQRFKTAEKDKQLEGMRHQIEELKRKAEQGSQKTQGDVLQIEIEAILKSAYPIDEINQVQNGVSGGDIIQKIMTPAGQHCGTILWEAKRTKTWNEAWIKKLKDDQRAITAEIAVIVTQTLPKGVAHLAQIDGVWVVDFLTFQGLAIALRTNLIQLFHSHAIANGKTEKMDFLYCYLTGIQFKQRVEIIIEAFQAMKKELEKEKRSIQKGWAAREQQLERVLASTVGMYGDIQGIVGASLPKIAALELEAPHPMTGLKYD
jgi:hypothetical protein